MYFLQNIPGSINDCYVREGVAKRLLSACELLPEYHYFVVFDAWRPKQVQMALFNQLKEELEAQGLKEELLRQKLSTFVDIPSDNPINPSNHLTGGAIDLTIGTEKGILNMGTDFDDFSEMSRTNAYEKINITSIQKEIRNNRRLLQEIMQNAGFTNYEEEWWHFDYGNQNWGKKTGFPAFYGGVESLTSNITKLSSNIY